MWCKLLCNISPVRTKIGSDLLLRMRKDSARARCDGYGRARSTLSSLLTASFGQLALCLSSWLLKKTYRSILYVPLQKDQTLWKIVVNFFEKAVSQLRPLFVCSSWVFFLSCSSPRKKMGCINCKAVKRSPSTLSSNGSERPSRAQQTIEKRKRKSARSLLRAILFAKKSKSSSRVTPGLCSSSQSDSPSPVCSY